MRGVQPCGSGALTSSLFREVPSTFSRLILELLSSRSPFRRPLGFLRMLGIGSSRPLLARLSITEAVSGTWRERARRPRASDCPPALPRWTLGRAADTQRPSAAAAAARPFVHAFLILLSYCLKNRSVKVIKRNWLLFATATKVFGATSNLLD